ncbi:unnamed protein product, partial [Mesorhabditis belari]|uniref:Uncharacterized protein n=1 Tax=Mesorhabditis belari TaxID=2138241 RepID=A0AAF3EPA8_9BILA
MAWMPLCKRSRSFFARRALQALKELFCKRVTKITAKLKQQVKLPTLIKALAVQFEFNNNNNNNNSSTTTSPS